MPRPIFVVGRRRSGTKWLSNALARHPSVACVQGRRSGILETSLFDRMPSLFGDLEIDSNYFAFLACYARSDFVQFAGSSERELYESGIRDYHGMFGYLMDRYAERQGVSHWVQKSKSYLLPDLIRKFPEARFLLIRRNLRDNVRSSMALALANRGAERPSKSAIVRELNSYYHHAKWENAFLDLPNVRLLHFEELRTVPETQLREACRFAGLDFDEAVLDSGYAPNTSFRGRITREQAFGRYEEMMLLVLKPLFRWLPLKLLDGAHHLRMRFAKPYGRSRFHPTYFRRFAKEIAGEGVAVPKVPPRRAHPQGDTVRHGT